MLADMKGHFSLCTLLLSYSPVLAASVCIPLLSLAYNREINRYGLMSARHEICLLGDKIYLPKSTE